MQNKSYKLSYDRFDSSHVAIIISTCLEGRETTLDFTSTHVCNDKYVGPIIRISLFVFFSM